IDKHAIDESGLLKSTSLGWQLLYILAVAITFANFFHQGFWQRSFSSKNDRELYKSTIYASIMLFPTLFLIGVTGLLAVWAGLCCDENNVGAFAFFSLLAKLPDWVVGFVIILSVAMSCSAYDTLQSAMVSTMSNDLFQNKLPLSVIRITVFVINVPAVVLALKNVDVLRVFLIGDLVAAATMPPVMLGLADSLYFLNWFDSLIGSISGLLGIFIFGTIFYGNAKDGVNLIQLPDGLYIDDYSVLGAFIVAPVAAVLMTFGSFVARMGLLYVWAKYKREEFRFPEKQPLDSRKYAGEEFTMAAEESLRKDNVESSVVE
ncbi:8993_t:CDS:2, partial [Paraglomus occultum]